MRRNLSNIYKSDTAIDSVFYKKADSHKSLLYQGIMILRLRIIHECFYVLHEGIEFGLEKNERVVQ